MESFRAGNICNYAHNWRKLTSDKNILDIVSHGLKLNFTDYPPEGSEPYEYPRGEKDFKIIDVEVHKLLKKEVIRPTTREQGEFFSSLFTRDKKDGTYRTILNLKSLNQDCDTAHFKMESLKQALCLVRRGSFLASIDIKDAFYSVPIHEDHKKFLKFSWNGQLFQFCAMPNGYCDAMRVFTKILKPVFATLREQGYESVIYVDDSLLQGDTYQECLDNIKATLRCLQSLGFVIHPTKSVLHPTQEIVFLGFIINTNDMTVRLTAEKKTKIVNLGLGLLNAKTITHSGPTKAKSGKTLETGTTWPGTPKNNHLNTLLLPPLGPLCAQSMSEHLLVHSGPTKAKNGKTSSDTCSWHDQNLKIVPNSAHNRGTWGQIPIFMKCYIKVWR